MFLMKLRFCQTLLICETTFGVLHFSSYWASFIVVRYNVQIYLFILTYCAIIIDTDSSSLG